MVNIGSGASGINTNSMKYQKQIQKSNEDLMKNSTKGDIHDQKAAMAALTKNVNSAKIMSVMEERNAMLGNFLVDSIIKEDV